MDKSLEFISTYAASLSYDELPPTTVQAAKQRLIDSAGCVLAAYPMEVGRACRRLCPPIDSPFCARVIGSLQRTTPDMAGFANAAMLRDLDLNDVYRVSAKAGGHPSNVIPAVLAAGEAVHADGKTLIASIVLAYEMYAPFTERSLVAKGFESDGLMATIGSVMGVGKVLGLTRGQMSNALSFALVSNINLGMRRVGEASMYKELYAGVAARQAILSALMAREGMTAPEDTIESEQAGLKKMIMADGKLELEPLGGKERQFLIERSLMKTFPVGGTIQVPIWAALELRKTLPAQDIISLDVEVDSATYVTSTTPSQWTPKTRETADHSTPVGMAIAIIDGDITPDSWLRGRFRDPDVVELVSKMRIIENPDFSREFPGKKQVLIEAKTRGGGTKVVHKVMTSEDQKVDDAMVESKFFRSVGNSMTRTQARAFLDLSWHIEDIHDCALILDRLRV